MISDSNGSQSGGRTPIRGHEIIAGEELQVNKLIHLYIYIYICATVEIFDRFVIVLKCF